MVDKEILRKVIGEAPDAGFSVNMTKQFHNLCYQCWEALEIKKYTSKSIVEHIRLIMKENKSLRKKLIKIKSIISKDLKGVK